MASTWVKICGITNLDDALAARDAGADAIGLNFVLSSPRCLDWESAYAITRELTGQLELIAVIADLEPVTIGRLKARTGLRWLQFHGRETPEMVAAELPHAFKAVAIGGPQDIDDAARMPGERLLCDTRVPGQLGGTGRSFDWRLAAPLIARRKVIVAGGLNPTTVQDAIATVAPWGVDTASGVEISHEPRRKDRSLMAAFVRNARWASEQLVLNSSSTE